MLRSRLRLAPEAVHPAARRARAAREETRFFSRRGQVRTAPPCWREGCDARDRCAAGQTPRARPAPCTGRQPRSTVREARASYTRSWPTVSPSFKVQLLERGDSTRLPLPVLPAPLGPSATQHLPLALGLRVPKVRLPGRPRVRA